MQLAKPLLHTVYMYTIIDEYVTQNFTTLRKSITARKKSNLFTVYLKTLWVFQTAAYNVHCYDGNLNNDVEGMR